VWVFEKKAQVQALILQDEGSGRALEKEFHGVDWMHHHHHGPR
jgi:hypothetical protein